MMNTSKSTDMNASSLQSSGGARTGPWIGRRESKRPVTVVGGQSAGRGADQDGCLWQRGQGARNEQSKDRVACALRHGRDRRVAQCLIVLPPAAALKGECPIEPPGQDARRNQRHKTRQKRMHLFHEHKREKGEVGGKPEPTRHHESEWPRQAAHECA